ncbi:hypothetical protein M406DRAFT_330016 [Cryphonectria parasitica EP155]|uniref:Uncharacterized protein n=1 Tax=Cryphonectria parasitica (strain ATCC 38755 / EP155) TaxID=660469 RepID=A0A9P4Y3A2_CRYP1|nr:uncharacterized protein M406DRAFT_330016 [Cryphonectria parasitica EP155]KAF3766177.1 hypothetical protein M406DRAFT_330016 [Cryphonectria parasitica EP155]
MCCAFEEHKRCQKCSKIWNRESHHIACARPLCRRDLNLSSMPPLVNTDTCLTCRMAKRREQEEMTRRPASNATTSTTATTVASEEAETDGSRSGGGSSSTGSRGSRGSSMGSRKLTPLFWDSKMNGFSDVWSFSGESSEDDGWDSVQF